MFFSAYVGGDEGYRRWRSAIGHTSRLAPTVFSRTLTGGGRLALSWLGDVPDHPAGPCVLNGDRVVLFKTRGQFSAEELSCEETRLPELVSRDWASSVVRIAVDTRAHTVTVAIPPATPQQVSWAPLCDGYVLADDLRLLARLGEREPDDRAVFALFQYGLVPPPLTMFRGVSRVPGGHVLTLEYRSRRSTCTPLPPPASGCVPGHPDVERWIADTLDGLLVSLPSEPVLYFSGGVDSAVLASRLVALGRRDVRLVNYAFGDGDEESRLAMRMASHFGLACTRIVHEATHVARVLHRVGDDYSYPFGDFSTVPTNILVHESRDSAPPGSTVLEGTGADGAFGLAASYPSWRRVYSLPAPLRQAGGALFRGTRLWSRDSSATRLAGFVTRSAHLPLEPAVIAQNALDGVGYRTPPAIREELHDLLMRPVRALCAARGEPLLSMLDMMMVCAGTMAAKSFDPLRRRGVAAVYPYLTPSIAYGASGLPAATKFAHRTPKYHLKALLAREVPGEWVYRRKSGFTPPYREWFSSRPLQDYLQSVVLDRGNPLLDWCDVSRVREMVDGVGRGHPVSPGVYDFLWVLAFSSGWLHATAASPAQAA